MVIRHHYPIIKKMKEKINIQISNQDETSKPQNYGENRIMFRWRCSLWRLIWRELILYTGAFLVVSLIYRDRSE